MKQFRLCPSFRRGRHFAEQAFLHEDLLIGIADRVEQTAAMCTARELCLLLDAYATARCHVSGSYVRRLSLRKVQSVLEAITEETLRRLEETGWLLGGSIT